MSGDTYGWGERDLTARYQSRYALITRLEASAQFAAVVGKKVSTDFPTGGWGTYSSVWSLRKLWD